MAKPARNRLKKLAILLAAAAGTLLLVGAMAIALTNRNFSASGRIARNVQVAGIAVQNLDTPQALEALHCQWAPTLPKQVALKYPGGEIKTSPENLGVHLLLEEAVERALHVGREGSLLTQLAERIKLWRNSVNIEVETRVDEETLRRALVELAGEIDRNPRNAQIEVVGEEVNVVPGETGRALDVEASAAKLQTALTDPRVASVDLVVTTVKPAVTAQDLKHIEVVLSEYSTPYHAYQRDRTHNLKLATNILNKTVVMPGEEFSLNEVIGPRLTELGYRDAPIFIEGEVRPSVGGGLCQVASTTYNAALLANLRILERHHHSRPVHYCPTGRDATVYWGQYDFKFANSLSHPILILSHLSDSRLYVKMLGSREDDYDVEIYRTGLTRIAHARKEEADPELEAGKTEIVKPGRDGWRVTTHRRVKRNGEVIKDETLHTDYYAPQTGEVHYGAKHPEEELPGAELAPGEEAPPEGSARPSETELTPQPPSQ